MRMAAFRGCALAKHNVFCNYMKQKTSEPEISSRRAAEPSRLQRELLVDILRLIRTDGLTPGTRLAEVALAKRLQVSRTPVRAALGLLARRGLVKPGARRGYFVAEKTLAAPKKAPPADPTDTDLLFLAIARDRRAGKLAEEVSERDLMRRYEVTRPTLQRVLAKLAEVTAVQRKPGHGWRFQPSISDSRAREESYRFRQILEPAALLEPGFQLDPAWAADIRSRHQNMLSTPWSKTTSIALFEMNAQFHEGLVAASQNRYLLVAIQQQNRLRRFGNYDWTFGYERVVVNCREHLAILDRLEAGDRNAAAELMRQHLARAAALKRKPAGSAA
jgi:DNA-binding GntR family transcriptional regulator